MLHVRTSRSSDSRAIAELILPIQQVEFGIAITLEDQPDLGNIEAVYRRGLGNFWIAEVGGQVVGTIALLDIGNKDVALRKMFVAAPFRGREFGVAQRLLTEALAWAVRHDVATVYLGTTDRFLAAHRFYEKHGFAELARSDLPGTFPVMAVDSKFYSRSLRSSAC